MKTLILIFLSFSLSAQVRSYGDNSLPPTKQYAPFSLKKAFIGSTFAGFAGVFHAGRDATLFHYDQFKTRFPRANDQFFDPRISWENKYRLGSPHLGPKFPGSRTYLVAFTDYYHLSNSLIQTFSYSSSAIYASGPKEKWWHYAIYYSLGRLAYGIGFEVGDKLSRKQ